MPDIDSFRTVATRMGPDPVRLAEFAERINAAKSPVIVYGSDLARSEAWHAGIRFAETLDVPVWTAPFAERTPFPETHRLHAGALPAAIGPLGKKFAGHDLVVVIGAPVFRYYPYVGGEYVPKGTQLLQITDDPNMSSKAPIGDSLVSDARLFLDAIQPLIKKRSASVLAPLRGAPGAPDMNAQPLAGDAIMAAPPISCWSKKRPRWSRRCRTSSASISRTASTPLPRVASAGTCLPRSASRWPSAKAVAIAP